MTPKTKILFLCTGNSARSQMAEALLRHLAGDRYETHSAGTEPKGLHPRTTEVMREVDIDVGTQSSKGVDRYEGQRFDRIITVCDRARQQCPVFPGAEPIHWDLEDPVEVEGDGQLEAFRRVRDEIARRVRLFVESEGRARAGDGPEGGPAGSRESG